MRVRISLTKNYKKGTSISVITRIELLSLDVSIRDNEILQTFISECEVQHLSEQVVDEAIRIRKNHPLKTPDAIIAATAMVHRLEIITRNIRDFKGIEGLTLINPWIF